MTRDGNVLPAERALEELEARLAEYCIRSLRTLGKGFSPERAEPLITLSKTAHELIAMETASMQVKLRNDCRPVNVDADGREVP